MIDPIFHYLDSHQKIVTRTWPDGHGETHLLTAPEYQAWLEAGNTPSPALEQSTQHCTVPAAAFKRALAAKGWLGKVRAAIAGADDLTQELWNSASLFASDDPIVAKIASALGRTSGEIAEVFELAATYK